MSNRILLKEIARLKSEKKKLKNKLKEQEAGGYKETPDLPQKPPTHLHDPEELERIANERIHKNLVTKELAPDPPLVLRELEENPEPEEPEPEEPEAETIRPSDVFAYQTPKKKRTDTNPESYGKCYEELYKMLCLRMLNTFARYFTRTYNKSKSDKECRKRLSEIPQWDSKRVKAHAKKFVDLFPEIETYYKFCYAANLMLMSSIVQKSEASEDIEVEVPAFSDFVHKCYIECARSVYGHVGCLSEDMDDHERLAVKRELYVAYGNAIATALRLLIPLDKLITLETGENFEDIDVLSASESEESEDDEQDEQDDEDDEDEQDNDSSDSSDSSSSESE